MLISKIPENDGVKGEIVAVSEEDGDSHEYQTANELFELMAKNQNFDTTDVDKLTTRDLVLLYKNIDLGTKLMSNANELRRRKPNQHVESVVYHDESDSDASERYSCEDLRSVFRINDERLDLIDASSAENTLCHKLGDLQMQTSNLATDYDKHFLFKDPYINEQLKSLRLMNETSDFEGAVLPASLLDYICCKRLEDNYNFYLENIIRYVKNTIDQLKRISNGDYLTAKAKEKWREVLRTEEDLSSNTKVLATSTSIPLHVERKISRGSSTWDDIVHSAVDLRTLSRILEKKIIVEIPKLLCGPYKLLSKCCAESLIISCKKDERPVEERVDVVLQLQRSETGQVISNINSIMILQSAPVERDTRGPEVLPLPLTYLEPANEPYTEQTNNKYLPERTPKIIELEQTTYNETVVHEVFADSDGSSHSSDIPIEHSYLDGIEFVSDNDIAMALKNSSFPESSDSNDALKDVINRNLRGTQREASRDVFHDDLRMTMQKLTMQSAVTEESGEDLSQSTSKKKKSPTRTRIKSPYENQSYVLEEKKRRKLLEIRERRERKKMALAENCKISKHKYSKGTMPQAVSSVTKLSISNKSFYNSIYGQTANADPGKQVKGRNRNVGKRDVLDIDLSRNEGEHNVSVASMSDKNSKKYTNRSYYLDDADTEMMYINMKRNENDPKEICSTSTSVISNVFRSNLNYLSQLIGPSESDLNIGADEIFPDKEKLSSTTEVDDTNDESSSKELLIPESILQVPDNSPTVHSVQNNTDMKKLNSVECRKSIDKIYTLMNNLEKAQENESKPIMRSKFVVPVPKKVDEKDGRLSSTCQGSESGTSLKHHMISSNPSSFSFDRNNTDKPNNAHYKKHGSLSPIIPKVIISSKSPPPKADLENNRKNRRKSLTSPTKKIAENPLKAISQLLHEFESVQKNRQKPNTDQKNGRIIDMLSLSDDKSGKSVPRKSPLKRRSRLDHHNESEAERYVHLPTPKDNKFRQHKEMDSPKIHYQKIYVDDKHTEKPPRKKIIELLEEAKEARGEAVRGPSKSYISRLNSLAQPKKTYVQAHNDDYQTKYGKTVMTNRLQRVATTQHSSAGSGRTRNKAKRSGSEAVSAASPLKPPSPAPLPERVFRSRHSRNSSPVGKERLTQVTGSSFKQASVPITPQTLKKKMVAVESYVKNHYGRVRPNSPVSNNHQSAHKLRVPLLPTDIDLASSTSSALTSFHESSELGSRLHNIISSIMKTTATPGLEVLPECHETISLAENISCAEAPSSSSDYILDIMDDNNVRTSVENIDKASQKEQKQTNVENTDAIIETDLQPVGSDAELEKLENALCNHLPVGRFQNRLRIKNLTMTPKQSMQNVFVLQSGDAGSLVVQTPIANSMKIKSSENFSDLTVLPILSKSHLDWNFVNFPMKIATVGYAFPEYKSIKRSSNSLVQLLDEIPIKSEVETHLIANNKTDEGSYTPKGAQPILRFEQAAQVDILATATCATVGISTSFTHIEESDKKQEINPDNATKEPPIHVFIDISQNKKEEDTFNGEQTQTQTVIENKENVSIVDKPGNIEYTTSLDILVGLLNEIQNISTCQTQMTKGDKIPSEIQQTKVLETILINEAAALGNSLKSSHCDVVSLSSLDRLRQLESNPSLYSFYLSDNDGYERGMSKLNFPSEIISNYNNELWCPNRIYVDKEVGADWVDREAVSELKDVSSQLLPAGMSSEVATHPLMRVLSEPSIQSMLFAECRPVESNAAPLDSNAAPFDSNDAPSESNAAPLDSNAAPFDSNDAPLESNAAPLESIAAPLYSNAAPLDSNATPLDSNAAPLESNAAPLDSNATPLDSNATPLDSNAAPLDSNAAPLYSNTAPLDHKGVIRIPHIVQFTTETKKSLDFYDVGNHIIEMTNENKSPKKITESFEKERIKTLRKAKNGKFRFKTDFDPIMKMKRDILVTVYSILVFTVFAALSFPEMLYRI